MQNKEVPYIELKDICRYFGVTKALEKMNLSLYSGEVIGLIGPNGAGKSTLMKVLTGVLPQTSGEIIVKGKVAGEKEYHAKKANEIGIVCAYQDLSLCTNLSVYENFAVLNEGHSIMGKPGWRKKASKNAKDVLEKFFPNNNITILYILAER